MIPKTDDGRVLFAIPWQGRVLVGTTDTSVERIDPAPRPLESELEFLLTHIGRYLEKAPTRDDVLCCFAGLRPLVKATTTRNSALIPRDHHIDVSPSGMVTITGGKWTTYRRMAKETVDTAARSIGLAERPCRTEELRLHGATEKAMAGPYGSDIAGIKQLLSENGDWAKPIHPTFSYTTAEVVWAVRQEMARTVEDVLARRTRALFLDSRVSMEASLQVARLIARELNRSSGWAEKQVVKYGQTARACLLEPN
jgi:glycerol-3-phosphate dehydrogenase